jgi:hypothetical protein
VIFEFIGVAEKVDGVKGGVDHHQVELKEFER